MGLVLALLGSTMLPAQAQKLSPFVVPAWAYTPTSDKNGTFVDISSDPSTVMLGNELADGAGLLNYIYEATSTTNMTPTGKTGTNTGTFNASAPLSEPGFPLGFDFKLSGKPMKYFIVNALGGAYFSETPLRANATGLPAYSSGYNAIYLYAYAPKTSTATSGAAPVATTFTKIPGQAPAMYLISGEPGNKVLTIQYHYMANGTDEWKFQYKFYENGDYEFIVDQLSRQSLASYKYPQYDLVFGFLESFHSGTVTTASIAPGGSTANADKEIDLLGPAYLTVPAAVTGSQHKAYYPGSALTSFNKTGDFLAVATSVTSGKHPIKYSDDIPSGTTVRFNYPTPCGEISPLQATDYEYTDPAVSLSSGSTYTSQLIYKMPIFDGTNYGPLSEFIDRGAIVAVLSASETPDYTLPTDGTLLFAGDVLGEGTDGVKPTVLCNKFPKITQNISKNTFTLAKNTTSVTTNQITLTVDGITPGVTRYIHLYRMAYACSGAPAYSPLCHTIVLQKPVEAPKSLEIVGLPTINSVQLKAKAADGMKVMVVKSSTLSVKPSGVLKVGDNIGSNAKVVAMFDGEQAFNAALNADEKCYFLAFSVNTSNPNSYAYSAFDVKNENLWVRTRAAYNGLPGAIDMSKEQHGTPNTAYNGFNTSSLEWLNLEPTVYRDLPFGWTREIVSNNKSQGFGLGKVGYYNKAAVSLYAACTYNQTTQMDAITVPILANKNRILVTYEMQLFKNSDDGLSQDSPQTNDQFQIQYAIGNGTWQTGASWTGNSLPAIDDRNVYKLTYALENDNLTGQYIRFRFVVNGANSRQNTTTYVAINTVEIKEDKVCKTPTDIRQNVTQTTTTQIGLTWVDPNTNRAPSYIVSYKRADAAGDWATKTVTTNSATLTNLRNANTYLVRVNAVCSANEDSYLSDTVTFSTAWTFPYEEAMAQRDTMFKVQGSNATIAYYSPFPGKSAHPAITRRDGGVSTATGSLPNNGNANLTTSVGDGSDPTVFTHIYTFNYVNNIKMDDGYGVERRLLQAVGVNEQATQAWLITPVIYTVNLESDEPLVVRFKAKSASRTGTAGLFTAGSIGAAFNTTTLKVLVSNTGNFSSNDVIGTVNVGTETIDGKEYEFELPTPLTGTVQVAFYYNNPNGTDNENNNNYMTFEISDVRYEYKNDVALCPALEGLERKFMTASSATFEWAPSEAAAYYEFAYGPKDETDYTNTVKLTEAEYTITGLDEQTTYKVMVTGYCDEEGENAAPDPLTAEFTTPEGCHPPTSFRVQDVTYYGATFTSKQTQTILEEREVKVVSTDESHTKVFKQPKDTLVQSSGLYDNTSYVAQTRSICRYGAASMDTSEWSTAITFTTPQDPANMPDTFNIQLLIEPLGAGTATGAGQYLEDEVVTMKATPNAGYKFVEWRDAKGNTISKNATRTVTMKTDETTTAKTHDSSFTAVFVRIYNIEVNVNNTAYGSATGGGTYENGQEVTLTATPKTNYVFDEWQDGNGQHVTTNATYKFKPTADASFTAVFRAKNYYSLDVAVTPNADWGSVTLNPQPNEDEQYQEGRSVTMTAVPAQYCKFVSWQDADGKVLSTDASYTVTMDGNKAVKAVFAQIRYTVTLKSDPSTAYGTINGTSGSTSTGGTFNAGTTRRLEAKPKSGYAFVKWMSGTKELGSNPVLEFVLTQDTTITAYFKEKEELDITVTVDPVGAGTITGAGKVKRGENAVLTATPNAHYAFKEWKRLDNTTVSANPYTFKPDRDYTFTAVFRNLEQFLVTVTTQGVGSVTGGGTYEEGATATLTATAGDHYHFAEWQDSKGNTLGTDETYTFTVTEGTTITAVFTENTKYTVSLTRLPSSAAGTTTGTGQYEADADVTITATPAKGYKFVEWQSSTGTTVSDANPYTFTMPARNVSYRAVFEALCEIKVTVDPVGAATVTGAGTYDQGESVTLEATVDESYVFVEWRDATGGNTISTANPYTFTATTGQNIKAVFREKGYFSIDVPCLGGDDDEDDLGSVSIPGDDGGEYMEGETVTMTAQPIPYCRFVEWRDKDGKRLSTNPTYTFVISQDTTFYAVFAHIQYTVTLKSDPSTTYGTINGTTGSTSTGGTFNAGTTRRLEAKPKSGYAFVKWMSGSKELGTNPVLEFVLTKDTTITAYFAEKTELTITVNVNPTNAGTVTGAGTVQRGQDAVLAATANNGYKFLYWERIDGTQHEDNPYTLVKPQRDYTFTAKFRAKEQYTINVATAPYTAAGTVTRSGFLANGKAEEDATVTLTATPAEGYRFVEWQDATGKQVGTEPALSFQATANATYKAVFEEIPELEYTITVNIEPADGGRIYNDGTHPAGKEVTLRARANSKYTFDGWYDATGTTKLSADTLYKVTATADITYTAKFVLKPTVDVAVTVRLGETVDATVGTVTGAGTYDKGKTVTLTAKPSSEDYLFSGWRDLNNDDELISSANPLTFTATENVHYAAVFREKFEVTLNILPDENAGTVTGAGAGRQGYPRTITAEAAEGYKFVGWLDESGNTVTTETAYTFTLEGNVTYTAKFEVENENEFNITVKRMPNNDAGTVKGNGRYAAGEQATLTATAATNYLFVGWLKPKADDATKFDTIKSNPYTFTVEGDASFTALFRARARYMIDVDILPNDDAGTVTGDGEHREGRTVTLEATPAAGYTFVAWVLKTDNPSAKDTVSRTSTYTFTASRNATYKAVFRRTSARYTLTLNVTPAIGGTVTGEGVYSANGTVTVTATPNTGYTFTGWRNTAGKIVSAEPSYSFQITGDLTLTAVFKKKEVITVTLNVTPENAGTVTGSGEYPMYAEALITATPVKGYRFVEWRDEDGATVSTDAAYTFTVVIDVTYTAVFEESDAAMYTVKTGILPSGSAAGTATGDGVYEEGTMVTVTATPNPGYEFKAWVDDLGETLSTEAAYTFEVVADITCWALFEASTTTADPVIIVLKALPSSAAGTLKGAGKYDKGQQVTITAEAAANYTFVAWLNAAGDTVSKQPAHTFTAEISTSFSALFREKTANEQQLKAAFNVAAGNGHLYIDNLNAVTVREVAVFNTVGRQLAHFTPNSNANLALPVDARYSVLVVRVVSEQGVAIYKVYLH